MTRFGKRLAAEFEQEFSRLANEWYLKWHALARGEAVDLDDFRGGRIQLDGMRFDARAELAYWSAAARYARGKIEETFAAAENHIRARAGLGTEAIAEDTAIRLRSFLERVHRHAVFTEYRLKARGYPDERHLAARRDRAIAAEIRRRKIALGERYRSLSLRRKIAMAAASLATGRRRAVLLAAVFMTLFFCLARDSAAAGNRETHPQPWPASFFDYPPFVSPMRDRTLSNCRADGTVERESDSLAAEPIPDWSFVRGSSIAPPGVA
jgi:hypothetical protein